jgi:hypothetical protein
MTLSEKSALARQELEAACAALAAAPQQDDRWRALCTARARCVAYAKCGA